MTKEMDEMKRRMFRVELILYILTLLTAPAGVRELLPVLNIVWRALFG